MLPITPTGIFRTALGGIYPSRQKLWWKDIGAPSHARYSSALLPGPPLALREYVSAGGNNVRTFSIIPALSPAL